MNGHAVQLQIVMLRLCKWLISWQLIWKRKIENLPAFDSITIGSRVLVVCRLRFLRNRMCQVADTQENVSTGKKGRQKLIKVEKWRERDRRMSLIR